MSKGQDLYQEAKRLIPGGSNLYSKRGELYAPDHWPQFYQSAKGISVTDLDGRTYLDFSGAHVGSCLLGYSDEDVDQAVLRIITQGQTSSLLCPEEVELAKLLILLHPWAQQVRYTRSGGEAIAVAIRIAQARTGRTNIETHGSYHGWHVNNPVTGEHYLPWHEWDEYVHGPGTTDLAAIIVEPSRLTEPAPGFLEKMRRRADRLGAVLIFDEISSGFRRNLGGVHLHYGVTPDIAVFSKAMSNGYPMAAVVGTEKVMSAAQDTFISSTTWSERIGPTAAIAAIQKLWAYDVFEHTQYIGERVRETVQWECKQAGIPVEVLGPPQMLHFKLDLQTQTSLTRHMLDRGFLFSKDFYPMYAHTIEHVEAFKAALGDSLRAGQFAAVSAEEGIRR